MSTSDAAVWREFLSHDGRIVQKWPHYFPAYERHFQRFVGRSLLMVEIGVFKGGSLQMWKRYFGPNAVIVGLDVVPKCKEFEEDQIHVRIGDQSDPAFLQRVIDEFGTPDLVLDDGSHVNRHQRASFDFLYPRLNDNGVYMVEDLSTSYSNTPPYDGGFRHPGSFVEYAKQLVDAINRTGLSREAAEFWSNRPYKAALMNGVDEALAQLPDLVRTTDFRDVTASIHFYDGIAVFEKMRRRPAMRILHQGKEAGAPAGGTGGGEGASLDQLNQLSLHLQKQINTLTTRLADIQKMIVGRL